MAKRKYFTKPFVFIILIGLCIIIFTLFVVSHVFIRTNDLIKQDMLQQANDKLNIAFLLISQHYESYINGFFDESTAQKMTKTHLENLFYGPEKLDYFWVLTKDGILVVHPYLKKYLNQSHTEIDDPVYQKAVEKILQAVKENSPYVEYEFYKYESNQVEQKLSAIKVFEPWGWVIGTGYYKTTLLTKIKSIQGNFVIATVTFLGLIIVIYLAFLVQHRLANREISKLIQQTKEETDRMRTLIETMPQPVALFDKSGKLLDFNKAYSEIQNFDHIDPKTICFSDTEKDYGKSYELTLKTSSGMKWYTVHCIPVLNHQNDIEGFIQLYTDITAQKLQIIFWQDKAKQDPLTNIANRNTLDELVDNFPQLGDEFSVIMMDIDGFKTINDTYGHLVGDQVLVYFTETIKNSIRKDVFFIRYGGDEFLLIMPQTTEEIAKSLIERFRKSFQTPFKIDQQEIRISFCAGIASFPKDGKNLRELIDRADKALYTAKLSGKDRTGF